MQTAITPPHELLARHCDGDAAAFNQLVDLFRAPIHNYFYRCGLSVELREDLLQETFIKVHSAADSYRPEAPLKAWIFRIAVNTMRSHFRRRSSHETPIDPSRVREPAAPEPSSFELAEASEAAEWIQRELVGLPVAQREVVVLSCIEGLSHHEIADTLEIPVNTVKTHLRRARLSLAKALARRRREGET